MLFVIVYLLSVNNLHFHGIHVYSFYILGKMHSIRFLCVSLIDIVLLINKGWHRLSNWFIANKLIEQKSKYIFF